MISIEVENRLKQIAIDAAKCIPYLVKMQNIALSSNKEDNAELNDILKIYSNVENLIISLKYAGFQYIEDVTVADKSAWELRNKSWE